jgi:hypothetical protein
LANPGYKPGILQRAVDAVATHGSISAAGRALGLPHPTFAGQYKAAILKGLEPQVQALLAGDHAAPGEGYKLKGTSTLYGEDGKAKIQWVKTDAKIEELQRMQKAAFGALCADLKPISLVAAPRSVSADLLTLYTMTDCHVGMLAWDKETGADWDLQIAENVLADTLIRMIDAAPDSEVGLLNQLGDFLHFDSMVPMTPTHHHVLDADSRAQKMVQIAVRILRRVIEHMLKKHKKVVIEMKEGNHDPMASIWLRVMFAHLYEKNPRVYVNQSPNPYTVYEHGQTLLGFYHGHLAKLTSLGELFSAQFREQWGRCPFVYIHTGHKHHVKEEERSGCKIIQHPTLAAPDAYAARGGWLSKRQATSMTYSKIKGEVSRGIFIP